MARKICRFIDSSGCRRLIRNFSPNRNRAMNDTEIKELIRKLDSAVSKEGATASFRSFGETAVLANRQGYLRLGIEFMKRAYDETNDHSAIDYMISKESDFSIDHFTITQEEFDFLSQ